MMRARASVGTMFFVNGFVFASWVPFIPAVKHAHRLSDAQLGGILLAMAVGALLTLPLAGGWVGRHGSRILTAGGGLAFCLALPLPLMAPTWMPLVGALVLFGALNALLDVAMNAQAVQVERGAGRAILSSFHGLFSLGGLIGAAAAGAGMRVGLSPLHYATAVTVLSATAVLVSSRGLLPAQVDRTRSAPAALAWPTRPVLGLGLLAFAALMMEGAMADWSAVYLHDGLATSPALAAAGFAAFSGCMAAGRFAGDYWVNRQGPQRVLRLCALVAAVGMGATAAAASPWLAIAGFALVGLGASNLIPILFSAAGRVPDQSPGRALAAVATTGYLGFLAGPPVIGWLSEWAGMRWALTLLALLCGAIAARAAIVPIFGAVRPHA